MAGCYAISLSKLEEISSIESFSYLIVNPISVAGGSLRQIHMRSSQTQDNALDETRSGSLRYWDTEALRDCTRFLFNDRERLVRTRERGRTCHIQFNSMGEKMSISTRESFASLDALACGSE